MRPLHQDYFLSFANLNKEEVGNKDVRIERATSCSWFLVCLYCRSRSAPHLQSIPLVPRTIIAVLRIME